MAERLQGKTALVTGASRGIGRATALLFAREGAAVVVNYHRSEKEAAEVVETVRARGGRALAWRANVAERKEVQKMVEASLQEFGKVDILVNNAGVLYKGSTLTLQEDQLDEMLTTNLKGIIYCVQAAVPAMMERGYGKIVNLSSIAALGTAFADTTPYALSKAAVIALTKRLALELGPHGINVNAICPGFIRTDLVLGGTAEEIQARLQNVAQKAMLRRVGEPEEIASTALFLASDESSFLTGQSLTVDGGRTDFLSHST